MVAMSLIVILMTKERWSGVHDDDDVYEDDSHNNGGGDYDDDNSDGDDRCHHNVKFIIFLFERGNGLFCYRDMAFSPVLGLDVVGFFEVSQGKCTQIKDNTYSVRPWC